MFERLERLVQLPATRVCAPFVLGGLLMLVALANDTPRALQAGGLIALLATLVLLREASRFAARADDDRAFALLHTHLLGAAMHAALFASSFLLASLGMAMFAPSGA